MPDRGAGAQQRVLGDLPRYRAPRRGTLVGRSPPSFEYRLFSGIRRNCRRRPRNCGACPTLSANVSGRGKLKTLRLHGTGSRPFVKYVTDLPATKILALEGSQSPANRHVYNDPQVAASPPRTPPRSRPTSSRRVTSGLVPMTSRRCSACSAATSWPARWPPCLPRTPSWCRWSGTARARYRCCCSPAARGRSNAGSPRWPGAWTPRATASSGRSPRGGRAPAGVVENTAAFSWSPYASMITLTSRTRSVELNCAVGWPLMPPARRTARGCGRGRVRRARRRPVARTSRCCTTSPAASRANRC